MRLGAKNGQIQHNRAFKKKRKKKERPTLGSKTDISGNTAYFGGGIRRILRRYVVFSAMPGLSCTHSWKHTENRVLRFLDTERSGGGGTGSLVLVQNELLQLLPLLLLIISTLLQSGYNRRRPRSCFS
jgi:hypothetical protein